MKLLQPTIVLHTFCHFWKHICGTFIGNFEWEWESRMVLDLSSRRVFLFYAPLAFVVRERTRARDGDLL